MITSIVLTDTYNIEISNNKIKTPDGVTINTKDIPFVRYRFNEYTQDKIEYIKENRKKFACVHVVEMTVGVNTIRELELLKELDEVAPKILYVDITDKEVDEGLSDDTLSILSEASDYEYKWINIRDKSNTLFMIAFDRIRKQISKATGDKLESIGCCGGPLCFIDGLACLTAVKARELLADYSELEEDVVPSANHEGKIEKVDELGEYLNKCGCIRYYVYNSDIAYPKAEIKGKKKENKGSSIVKDTIGKNKKIVNQKKGYRSIKW